MADSETCQDVEAQWRSFDQLACSLSSEILGVGHWEEECHQKSRLNLSSEGVSQKYPHAPLTSAVWSCPGHQSGVAQRKLLKIVWDACECEQALFMYQCLACFKKGIKQCEEDPLYPFVPLKFACVSVCGRGGDEGPCGRSVFSQGEDG